MVHASLQKLLEVAVMMTKKKRNPLTLKFSLSSETQNDLKVPRNIKLIKNVFHFFSFELNSRRTQNAHGKTVGGYGVFFPKGKTLSVARDSPRHGVPPREMSNLST